MRRAVAIGLLAAAVASGPGCKSKKKRAPSSEPAPAPAPAAERPVRQRPARPAPGKQRRRIEPITVDEMTSRFEAPAGATVVMAPSKPRVGERVQAAYCFENTEIATAAEAIKASLEAGGWTPVHVRIRAEAPDRAAVASEQAPYRVSASIQRARAPTCPGDQGHAYVSLTMHKVNRTPAHKPPRAISP